MPYVRTYRHRGLGASAQQLVGQVGGASSGIVAATAGPALATALGISASLAVPIVGAVFAGVLAGVEAILNSGCGQSCVITSNWADDAEQVLQKNAAAYFSLATPRPASAQTQALSVFDQVWQYLYSNCNNAQLGTAGVNCIKDRQAGGCKWKMTNQPQYPLGPVPGDCFNWFVEYRDPIANDPNVISDVEYDAQNAGASVSQLVAGWNLPVWLLLAVALGGVYLVMA